MITEGKYNEIITYAHGRLAAYPHLDPYDVAHETIMHPEFSAEGTEWRRLFKTAMYRALDITNKEVALEAAGIANCTQAEENAECGNCGELSPVAGWRRGMCVKCYSRKWYYENQDYVRAYRKRHKKKYLEYKREWYKANRDRLRREARDYYYANREKMNEYSREYYRAKVDKEARKTYNREYYKRNRERIIAQVKANQKRKKEKKMGSETIKMEIKNIAGDVIYCSPTAETIKQAVEEAVNKGEDLSGADLEGAIIKP